MEQNERNTFFEIRVEFRRNSSFFVVCFVCYAFENNQSTSIVVDFHCLKNLFINSDGYSIIFQLLFLKDKQ